jgi:hypothetical protein
MVVHVILVRLLLFMELDMEKNVRKVFKRRLKIERTFAVLYIINNVEI